MGFSLLSCLHLNIMTYAVYKSYNINDLQDVINGVESIVYNPSVCTPTAVNCSDVSSCLQCILRLNPRRNDGSSDLPTNHFISRPTWAELSAHICFLFSMFSHLFWLIVQKAGVLKRLLRSRPRQKIKFYNMMTILADIPVSMKPGQVCSIFIKSSTQQCTVHIASCMRFKQFVSNAWLLWPRINSTFLPKMRSTDYVGFPNCTLRNTFVRPRHWS